MKLRLPRTGKGPCWTLRIVKREPKVDGHPVWGYCDSDKREIVIHAAAAEHGLARETLIHEALHRACPFFSEEAVDHLAKELDGLLDFAEHKDILDL